MTSSDKVTITAAIIGLVGVLGAAVVSNWDKIFPPNASHVGEQASVGAAEGQPGSVAGARRGAERPGRAESLGRGRRSGSAAEERAVPPARSTQQTCIPILVTPAPDAILPQRRSDARQVELDWTFGWRSCPEASRYHLYIIGPKALNPLVNVDTLMSAVYQFRRSGGGVTARSGWTWMVRAYVDGEWGEWSEKRTFGVGPPEP